MEVKGDHAVNKVCGDSMDFVEECIIIDYII